MTLDYIPNEFGRLWVASQSEARRGVHTPLSYIDINEGNRFDGDLFAQIMYWHEPSTEPTKRGEEPKPRLTQERGGFLWLAKNHNDWIFETRIRGATVRKCLERLEARKLIFYEIYEFGRVQTPFIRVNWAEFERRMKIWLANHASVHNESDYDAFLKLFATPDIEEQPPDMPYQTPDIKYQPFCYLVSALLLPRISSITETTHETTHEIFQKITQVFSPLGESQLLLLIRHLLNPVRHNIFEEFVEGDDFDAEFEDVQPMLPDDYTQAIAATIYAFHLNGAQMAKALEPQLRGRAAKGKRKDYNIEPAMTPVEIVAFGMWYRSMYSEVSDKPSQEAERMTELVADFRDWYVLHPQVEQRAYAHLLKLLKIEPVTPSVEQQPATQEEIDEATDLTDLLELFGESVQ
jgi:hypothetical protein